MGPGMLGLVGRLTLGLVSLALLLLGIGLEVIAAREGIDPWRIGRMFLWALVLGGIAIAGFGASGRRSRSDEIMERAHRLHRVGRFATRWVAGRAAIVGVAVALAVVEVVVGVGLIVEAAEPR